MIKQKRGNIALDAKRRGINIGREEGDGQGRGRKRVVRVVRVGRR